VYGKQCFFKNKSAATYHNPFFLPYQFVLLQTCNAESKRPGKLLFIFPLSSLGSLAFHRFSHVRCTGPADWLFAVYNKENCGGDGYNSVGSLVINVPGSCIQKQFHIFEENQLPIVAVTDQH